MPVVVKGQFGQSK